MPILPIVRQHVKLKQVGGLWSGCCPFHADKTPSFYVYPDHYHCFSCEAHGDAIEFLRNIEGVSFREAVGRLTGDISTVDKPSLSINRDREVAADLRARLRKARFIADKSIPMEPGSLGERYLVETRGIPLPATGWPASVRFLPAWNGNPAAVVFVATDSAGVTYGVQRVLIDADGRNIKDADGKNRKISRGAFREHGAVVRLPGSVDGHVLLAEGPEDGLTVWTATGCETWIAVGGIPKHRPPADRLVFVCRNDDPVGSVADVGLRKAVAAWDSTGISVVVASPWATRRGDKSDFNDLLRASGVGAVWERINTAMHEAVGVASVYAPRPLPTGTLADARAYLNDVGRKFFGITSGGTLEAPDGQLPTQLLITSEGGAGKTDVLSRVVPQARQLAKDKGLPHRVIMLVPEHAVLGSQVTERFRRVGLTVEHVRGRGDPFDPKPDDLCRNLESVKQAILAGQPVKESCCGAGCPIFDRVGCGYLQSKKRAETADVVVLAHNHMTRPLSKKILKDVGWVVIDENFLPMLDWNYPLTVDSFGSEALDRWPVLLDGEIDRANTHFLRSIHGKIQALAAACAATGRPAAEAISKVDLTLREIREARKLNWRRRVDAPMAPKMNLEDRKEIARSAAINSKLPRIAVFFDALEALMTEGETGAGRIEFTTKMEKNGAVNEIAIHTQHRLASWIENLPVLMLNATANPDEVRRFFPRTEEKKSDPIATPDSFQVQMLGGFSKGTMAKSPKKIADLSAFLAVAFPGRNLGVVGHKSSVGGFDDLPNARTTWHGKNAGDDTFKTVDVNVVFDGPRAKPVEIAALAAARTGRLIKAEAPVMSWETALMTDGRGVKIPVLRYQDPYAQAAHESVHHAAIGQAMARPRQVMRTAANPCMSLLFGNVASSKPVDLIIQWKDAKPDRLVHMVAKGRVCRNAKDMSLWHKDMFKTEKAASNANARFGDVRIRVLAMIRRDARPWAKVEFKPAGKGQHAHSIYCWADQVTNVRAEAEDHYGDLVEWKIEQVTSKPKEDIPISLKLDLTEMGMTSRPIPTVSAFALPAPLVSIVKDEDTPILRMAAAVPTCPRRLTA